ncbi:MAG: PAS domain S-box protein [Planctomycetes bacterium]|nr:PAS domain S-box protein [Planctomycetota bacterium]
MPSTSLHRELVEAAPIAMIMVAVDGTIALVNAEAEHLFGYDRDEMIGRPVELLVPERFRAEHPQLRSGFLAASASRLMGAGRDLFALRKDGSEVPVEIGLRPLTADSGQFVLAAVVDISARKRAEELFRTVVEAAPNATVMMAANGTIELVNGEAERLFGYHRDEMVGQLIELLVPESYRAGHPGHRTVYFREPTPRAMGAGRDLFALCKDGREVPVEIGLRPFVIDGRQSVLAAIVDISARKRAEDELRRYAVDLERSNRDLEDFAYIASHDLRSPLRAVENLASWIEEDAADVLSAESRENLALMRGRIGRLHRLLDDLLQYARCGHGDAAPVDVETGQIVARIVETLDVPAGFSIAVAPDLPLLRTMVTPLETCLRNLIANAIKHHDREDGRVGVTAVVDGGFAVFAVADDGPGIASEHHERIFKVFQTLKAGDEARGSGMGLAIIKKTVELSGGSIDLESEPGKGATFRMRWPMTPKVR